MTNMLDIDKIVYSYLKQHSNHFCPNSDLQQIVYSHLIGGYRPNPLEIRQAIQRLRAMGSWIIAGNKGYMLTTSKKDVKEYCQTRRTEIEKELRILYTMEMGEQ